MLCPSKPSGSYALRGLSARLGGTPSAASQLQQDSEHDILVIIKSSLEEAGVVDGQEAGLHSVLPPARIIPRLAHLQAAGSRQKETGLDHGGSRAEQVQRAQQPGMCPVLAAWELRRRSCTHPPRTGRCRENPYTSLSVRRQEQALTVQSPQALRQVPRELGPPRIKPAWVGREAGVVV